MEVGTPDREPGESAPFPRASATGTGFPGGGFAPGLFSQSGRLPHPRSGRRRGRGVAGQGSLLALAGEAPTEPPGTDGSLVGIIGALPQYRGKTWELPPLAVRADYRRQGIGRQLVAELERAAATAGVSTIYLGTDDTEAGRA